MYFKHKFVILCSYSTRYSIVSAKERCFIKSLTTNCIGNIYTYYMRTHWMSPVVSIKYWANITTNLISLNEEKPRNSIQWTQPILMKFGIDFIRLATKLRFNESFIILNMYTLWPEITIQIQFENKSFHQMPANKSYWNVPPIWDERQLTMARNWSKQE